MSHRSQKHLNRPIIRHRHIVQQRHENRLMKNVVHFGMIVVVTFCTLMEWHHIGVTDLSFLALAFAVEVV